VEYRPRVADQLVSERLPSAGAVVLEGPKACGKTWTAHQFAASEVLLDVDSGARHALDADPALILEGASPRLVDEWQIGGTPLWNHVRRTIDDRQSAGQFILTGSSTPPADVTRHSGAGRFARITMRPMSLYELGDSTGEICVAGLLAGEHQSCPDPGLGVRDIIDRIAIGGWPANLNSAAEGAVQQNIDYLAHACEVDIPSISGARRDPERLRRLLTSLARNTATEVKISALARETLGDNKTALARTTIYDYLAALQRLMLVDDVPAWSTHLRSRATLRQEPKRHFVDPSLAVAALATTPKRLLDDLSFAGLLFESLVMRDLRVLSSPLRGTVAHYRDSNGIEADVVLQIPDGTWGAFEVKLGPGRIDDAAASLLRFASTIDTGKAGDPAVLGVITTATYGYTRKDGIQVIPVAALCP
jgi:predicted AAA+ superfamily ATPase